MGMPPTANLQKLCVSTHDEVDDAPCAAADLCVVRLWASEREAMRRATEEREERWRGERDAMQSKVKLGFRV